MKYCNQCGELVTHIIPPNDDRIRHVCKACDTVHYDNPKMVVGCIPVWRKKILMTKRGIKPRFGKWTLPAGYLENGESVADGARRETYEESRAEVVDLEPYALFNIIHVNQVYLMFRGRLVDTNFGPTHESSEVRLFRESEIPWEQIAFSSIYETLRHFFEDRKIGVFNFFTYDINE